MRHRQPVASPLGSRRSILGRHPSLAGIDFVEVASVRADGWTLLVHFVTKSGDESGRTIPEGISPTDVTIRSLWNNADAPAVIDVSYPPPGGTALTVQARRVVPSESAEDYTTYVLELRPGVGRSIDPFFARATFSIPSEPPVDAVPDAPRDDTAPEPPVIDYLVKDYASFRRLILDQLARLSPDWRERNPADLGIVLVELLAYAGDYLSYYQDAVATEAYLATARRRISVRRHSRLLDYPFHDGCNARVWIHLEVDDERVPLPAGTAFLNHVSNQPTRLPTLRFESMDPAQRLIVHESMDSAVLFRAHNKLSFYSWGFPEYSLEPGATTATLRGHLPHLRQGDVLVLEASGGADVDSREGDRSRRAHPIRLATPPMLTTDPLLDQAITEIRWAKADALPNRFVVQGYTAGGVYETDRTTALGNVILADSGRTVRAEPLAEVPPSGRYYPRLRSTGLTFRVPDSATVIRSRSAKESLLQDPRDALAAIRVDEESEAGAREWLVQRDLLQASRFARSFVVEMESDGLAYLRFGDGARGRRPTPGSRFQATYRVSSGGSGNVGPHTIGHVVTDDERIVRARNPLAAAGSRTPEPIAGARVAAPRTVAAPESCVTPEDYARVAERHAEVQRAVGRVDWRGSWPVVLIFVDRLGRRSVDEAFRADVRSFLESHRIAGQDFDVVGPRDVPLAIRLTIRLAPTTPRNVVSQKLVERFSCVELTEGARGFFHPDNFTFGQPVYLSRILTLAAELEGVADVAAVEFHRWGAEPKGELASGVLPVGPDEIARLDNEPTAPEHGTIRFHLEGGR